MIAVCAWCGKDMGERDPYEDRSITHGICPECRMREFAQVGRPKSEDNGDGWLAEYGRGV